MYSVEYCVHHFLTVWFEPTCLDKAIKPILAGLQDKITYCSPNLLELCTMHNTLVNESKSLPSGKQIDLKLFDLSTLSSNYKGGKDQHCSNSLSCSPSTYTSSLCYPRTTWSLVYEPRHTRGFPLSSGTS